MQLSKNFFLSEMLYSPTAARMGRVVESPPPEVLAALIRSCNTVYQPIRDELTKVYGKDMPISITSGYRPKWLNTMIGGAPKSYHLDGLALDHRAIHLSIYDYAEFVRDRIQQWPIDQVILEFNTWVHISVARDPHAPKREVLTAVKNRAGKTQYLSGLVKGE